MKLDFGTPMQRLRVSLLVLFSLLTSLAAASLTRAQAGAGTGRIEGTVSDSSGSVVPGAEITATEETTNIAASVKSESDGHFVLAYVAPGVYTVEIKKDGFERDEIKHVVVRVGSTS